MGLQIFMAPHSNAYEIPMPQAFLPSRFFMAFCPFYGRRPHIQAETQSCVMLFDPKSEQDAGSAASTRPGADAGTDIRCDRRGVRMLRRARRHRKTANQSTDRRRCLDRHRTCLARTGAAAMEASQDRLRRRRMALELLGRGFDIAVLLCELRHSGPTDNMPMPCAVHHPRGDYRCATALLAP